MDTGGKMTPALFSGGQEMDGYRMKQSFVERFLFNILYVMVRENEPPIFLAYLFMLLEDLQMFSFSWNVKYGFEDIPRVLEIILDDPLTIPASEEFGFRVTFWVLAFAVLLLVGTMVFVGYSLQHGNFVVIWPLKVLRLLALAFMTFLFLPMLSIFLSAAACGGGSEGNYVWSMFKDTDGNEISCLGSSHLSYFVVGIISVVIIIPLNMLLTLTNFDPLPDSKNPHAKPHGRVEFLFAIIKIVLTASRRIDTTLLAITNPIAMVILTACFIRYQPYYSPFVNHVRTGFYFAASINGIIASINLAVTAGYEHHTNTALIVMGVMIPVGFIAGFLICKRFGERLSVSIIERMKYKMAQISKHNEQLENKGFPEIQRSRRASATTPSSPRLGMIAKNGSDLIKTRFQDPNNNAIDTNTLTVILSRASNLVSTKEIVIPKVYESQYEVEIAARFIRSGVKSHASLELMNMIFEEGLEQFDSCDIVRLIYAYYISSYDNLNILAAKSNLKLVKEGSAPLDVRFSIYFQEKYLQQKQKLNSLGTTRTDIPLATYVEYTSLEKEARESHICALQVLKDMWTYCSHDNPSPEQLPTFIRRLDRYSRDCTSKYEKLISRFPKSKEYLRLYAAFLITVKANYDMANNFIRMAEDLEEPSEEFMTDVDEIGDDPMDDLDAQPQDRIRTIVFKGLSRSMSREPSKDFNAVGTDRDGKDAKQFGGLALPLTKGPILGSALLSSRIEEENDEENGENQDGQALSNEDIYQDISASINSLKTQGAQDAAGNLMAPSRLGKAISIPKIVTTEDIPPPPPKALKKAVPTAPSSGGGSSTQQSRELKRQRYLRAQMETRAKSLIQRCIYYIRVFSFAAFALIIAGYVISNNFYRLSQIFLDELDATMDSRHKVLKLVESTRMLSIYGGTLNNKTLWNVEHSKMEESVTELKSTLNEIIFHHPYATRDVLKVIQRYQNREDAPGTYEILDLSTGTRIFVDRVYEILSLEYDDFQANTPEIQYDSRLRFVHENGLSYVEEFDQFCFASLDLFLERSTSSNSLLLVFLGCFAGLSAIMAGLIVLAHHFSSSKQTEIMSILLLIPKSARSAILADLDDEINTLSPDEDEVDSKAARLSVTSHNTKTTFGSRPFLLSVTTIFVLTVLGLCMFIPPLAFFEQSKALAQLFQLSNHQNYMANVVSYLAKEALAKDEQAWLPGQEAMYMRSYLTNVIATHEKLMNGESEFLVKADLDSLRTFLRTGGVCYTDIEGYPGRRNCVDRAFVPEAGYTSKVTTSGIDVIMNLYVSNAQKVLDSIEASIKTPSSPTVSWNNTNLFVMLELEDLIFMGFHDYVDPFIIAKGQESYEYSSRVETILLVLVVILSVIAYVFILGRELVYQTTGQVTSCISVLFSIPQSIAEGLPELVAFKESGGMTTKASKSGVAPKMRI